MQCACLLKQQNFIRLITAVFFIFLGLFTVADAEEVINVDTGQIVIVNDSIYNGPQDFSFVNDFGSGYPETFLLDDDSTVALPKQRTFTVPVGTYSVREEEVSNWQLESISCDDGNSWGDTETRIAHVMVESGEVVTCMFVNEEYSSITLVKRTLGGDGEFNFSLTGENLPITANLETIDGEGVVFYGELDQDNTYMIAELVPAGWVLLSGSCDNGDSISKITPNAGEDIICTFVNQKIDARISIFPPSATLDLNDSAEISVLVEKNDGYGWVPADGESISFVFDDNTTNASFVDDNVCVTDSSGTCLVKVEAVEVGDVLVRALVETSVGGMVFDKVSEASKISFVEFTNRSLGFWKTHFGYVDRVFAEGLNSYLEIGIGPNKTIEKRGDLFGALWLNEVNLWDNRKGKGLKRSNFDRERVRLLKQLLVAELNCISFGCAQEVKEMMLLGHRAYSETDLENVVSLGMRLKDFNESRNYIEVHGAGKADPKGMKEIIMSSETNGENGYEFWNDLE